MVIESLIARYVDEVIRIQANSQEELYEVIDNFIKDLFIVIPEMKYYKKDRTAADNKQQFHGKKYSLEEVKVLNGVICHLLSLVGTEAAYLMFAREQQRLKNIEPLILGRQNDSLLDGNISFKAWHNFISEFTLEQHATAIYIAATKGFMHLPKIKKLYKNLTNDPWQHQTKLLAHIFDLFLQQNHQKIFKNHEITFVGLLYLNSTQQADVLEYLAQDCNNLAIQQSAVPPQKIKELSRLSIPSRKLRFLVEYVDIVPSMRIPKDRLATAVLMHTQNLQQIRLLWQNFYLHSNTNLVRAYKNYQIARLVDLNIDVSNIKADFLPVLAFIMMITKTTDSKKAKKILTIIEQNIPREVIHTFKQEWNDFALSNSIAILNVSYLINNPIFFCSKLEDGFAKGLEIGLKLAALVYKKGRERLSIGGVGQPGVSVLNATYLANALNSTDNLDKMYEKIKKNFPIEQAFNLSFNQFIILENSTLGIKFKPVDINMNPEKSHKETIKQLYYNMLQVEKLPKFIELICYAGIIPKFKCNDGFEYHIMAVDAANNKIKANFIDKTKGDYFVDAINSLNVKLFFNLHKEINNLQFKFKLLMHAKKSQQIFWELKEHVNRDNLFVLKTLPNNYTYKKYAHYMYTKVKVDNYNYKLLTATFFGEDPKIYSLAELKYIIVNFNNIAKLCNRLLLALNQEQQPQDIIDSVSKLATRSKFVLVSRENVKLILKSWLYDKNLETIIKQKVSALNRSWPTMDILPLAASEQELLPKSGRFGLVSEVYRVKNKQEDIKTVGSAKKMGTGNGLEDLLNQEKESNSYWLLCKDIFTHAAAGAGVGVAVKSMGEQVLEVDTSSSISNGTAAVTGMLGGAILGVRRWVNR